MSGGDSVLGIIYLNVKIKNITRRVKLYVLKKDSFKYGLLIGLDLVKTFRLGQTPSLEIYQESISPMSSCDDANVMSTYEKSNDISPTSVIKDAKSMENTYNCTLNLNKKYSSYANALRNKLETTDSNNLESSSYQVNWNENIPIETFEAKTEHLTLEKKKVIYDFIDRYSSVFANNTFDVGTVNEHEARIQLLENRYVAKKPYRCSYEDQEEIEKQVTELLKHGMIEPSCSPFASPVTMAYKKVDENGRKEKTRMCIDFRELNKLVVPESQPFPLIDDIIAKTRDCSWFSAFDINSAFWSIPIAYEDRHKTGFITQNGHWQWVSMPFGLKNAPAVFQRILSGIIRKNKLSDFVINYIDDILIFSKSFEEHLQHLELLVKAILREGFRLKFTKCSFATHSVNYLGHVISKNTVRPLNNNLRSISDFPTPMNKKNIRQFLGKVNFYHKFLNNASVLLEPFHNLLRKNVPFVWSIECESSFRKVKDYLTSSPVLAIFERNLPIFIYTDASGVGIGAVLKQVQSDGTEKPVAYFSKKLNEAQRKKKAIYIESVAIREAVKFWRYWLIGRRFTIITDHKPLENLNLKARTDEELGDLANYLLQFDFEVIYRPGSKNAEADCLSRNPVHDASFGDDIPDILPSINLLTLEEIKASQNKICKDNNDNVKDGVIIRRIKGKYDRIQLDCTYGKQLIEKVHNKYGHIGPKHVYNIIRKYYTFEKMFPSIQEFCSRCVVCCLNKTKKGGRKHGLLGHFGPATKPFEIMSLDTIGGLGGKRSTKRYLHLLEDHFTRFAYILNSSNQNAAEFIKLIDNVQKENNITMLLTDQYGGLSSSEFTDYLNKQNIEHFLRQLILLPPTV